MNPKQQNSMLINTKQKLQFIVIPLVVFALMPVINDSLGIPKLIALIVGTVFLVANITSEKLHVSKILYIPLSLLIYYLVLQFINPIDLAKFLLGAYSRNGGFISLLCFTLIVIVIATNRNLEINNLIFALNLTINLAIIYSTLELLNLLPYKSLTDFGGKLTLTLANPNFASAFLGISITFKLFYAQGLSKLKTQLEYVATIYLLYLLYKSGSLQGFLVLGTGIFIYLLMIGKKSKLINFKRFILTFSCITTVTASYIVLNFNTVVNFFIDSGSAKFRIEYWKLSYNIWKDHKLFGVGIDNLASYSTKYRNEHMVYQEGIFTVPDRSHNVFLDHFVNGGVFAGLLWLFFVISLTYIALIILLREKKATIVSRDTYLIVSIWFGYIVQAMVSVDHLALTLLGFIAAGFILNLYQKGKTRLDFNQTRKIIYFRKLIFVVLIAILFFCLSIFNSERLAFLYFKDKNPIVLEKFYKSLFFSPNTFEKVTIDISKSKNFDLAYKFAQKLETHTLNNHQTKYIQSVYFESKNDFEMARKLMFEAHKLDKFNSVYTLGLALFEYRLGNTELALEYLDMTKKLNKDQQGLKEISEFIYSKT